MWGPPSGRGRPRRRTTHRAPATTPASGLAGRLSAAGASIATYIVAASAGSGASATRTDRLPVAQRARRTVQLPRPAIDERAACQASAFSSYTATSRIMTAPSGGEETVAAAPSACSRVSNTSAPLPV